MARYKWSRSFLRILFGSALAICGGTESSVGLPKTHHLALSSHIANTRAFSPYLHLLAHLPLLTALSGLHFLLMLCAISGQHQSRQIPMLARSTALSNFNTMLISHILSLSF